MKKVVSIYHKDCNDGTTAASVVLKKFPEAKLFPLPHSYTKEDLGPILEILDSETDIYTVDCALGVKEILNLGFKVTTIDHHIGGKEEFETLAKENSNFTYIFDNNKSGASLSWIYFFPNEELPEFIGYIEDSDLWTQKFGDKTKAVGEAVSKYRNMPEKMIEFIGTDLTKVIEEGMIIVNFVSDELKAIEKTEPIFLKIGNYEVPAYNIGETLKSQSGNLFSIKLNKTVIIFRINGEKVHLSFRSHDKEISPSALDLAKLVGGGGHVKASGATTTLKDFLEMIIK